jgi:hypothetical protein
MALHLNLSGLARMPGGNVYRVTFLESRTSERWEAHLPTDPGEQGPLAPKGCDRILRDHERAVYDPPPLPLDSQIDSKGYTLAVFIEHVGG